MLKRSTYIVVLLCNVMLFAGTLALGLSFGTNSANAACTPDTLCTDNCSPGIPCTGYDLYNDWNAGRDSNLNGPKTGDRSAGGYDDSVCDGNLMNQMYSKAFMEANRQVIMSEQIIHKPDSVLEYTCFEGFIEDAATVESVFSYTDRWEDDYEQDRETYSETITDTFDVYREDFNNGDTDCNPTMNDSDECANDLAEAMNYIINEMLDTYLTSNFDHTYLGEATTVDPSGTPSGCGDMATVWEIAKCLDFGEDDRFRTFADLINADPRSIPLECSSGNSFADDIEAGTNSTKLDQSGPDRINRTIPDLCPPGGEPTSGVETDFSNDLIRVANNCPSESASGRPGQIAHAYVMIDPVEYQDYLIMGAGLNSNRYIPGTGGSNPTTGVVPCANPLPTGIPVVSYEHDYSGYTYWVLEDFPQSPTRNKFVHYEYICPNPGCFYRPNKQALAEDAPIPDTTPIGQCVRY